ncbi:MAG: hypothetical protein AAFX05_09640, partial [Planctomycetota bacterium]
HDAPRRELLERARSRISESVSQLSRLQRDTGDTDATAQELAASRDLLEECEALLAATQLDVR